MAELVVKSATAADGTFSAQGQTVWDAGMVPVSGQLSVAFGGTGISSFGAGIADWLGTPSSANLLAAVTGETGTGALVFAETPTLVTPILGTPTSGTLTNCTGLPLATGVSGQLALTNGGTGANLADPNADRILFWDDSAGAVTWLTAGTGLSISGTTIEATGSGGTVDIEDEGAAEGAADTIDFVGDGVSVGFAAGKATVTIPGGAGSGISTGLALALPAAFC